MVKKLPRYSGNIRYKTLTQKGIQLIDKDTYLGYKFRRINNNDGSYSSQKSMHVSNHVLDAIEDQKVKETLRM